MEGKEDTGLNNRWHHDDHHHHTRSQRSGEWNRKGRRVKNNKLQRIIKKQQTLVYILGIRQRRYKEQKVAEEGNHARRGLKVRGKKGRCWQVRGEKEGKMNIRE